MDTKLQNEQIKVAANKLMDKLVDAQDALSTYRQVLQNVEGEINGRGWELATASKGEDISIDPSELLGLLEQTKRVAAKLAGAAAITNSLNSTFAHI
jgi:hypothetical protein